MATGRDYTDGQSFLSVKTCRIRIGLLLARLPWKSSCILVLLWLASHMSSCYGLHAESMSSSTLIETRTDKHIQHSVQVTMDGSLAAHMQEISKTLQAIERRFVLPPPPIIQSPRPGVLRILTACVTMIRVNERKYAPR